MRLKDISKYAQGQVKNWRYGNIKNWSKVKPEARGYLISYGKRKYKLINIRKKLEREKGREYTPSFFWKHTQNRIRNIKVFENYEQLKDYDCLKDYISRYTKDIRRLKRNYRNAKEFTIYLWVELSLEDSVHDDKHITLKSKGIIKSDFYRGYSNESIVRSMINDWLYTMLGYKYDPVKTLTYHKMIFDIRGLK